MSDGVWISIVGQADRPAPEPGLPLSGLTFAVKDNIDVAGMPTTAACQWWRAQLPLEGTLMTARIGPVKATPYLWPYDGSVPVERTALVCIVLSDCTGATDPSNHTAALHMVTMQGGVFGCVSTSDDVIAATEV